MKKDIHPKYYKTATITCTCGQKFTTGSTVETMTTELCSSCHPFYTGEQKIVDTANLVKKFEKRQKTAKTTGKVRTKKEKRAKRAAKTKPKKPGESLTLKDMLKGLQKGK